jgi:hypothetical protein
MKFNFSALHSLTAGTALAAVLLASPAQAQAPKQAAPKRVAIEGVKQTPISHCVAGTIKFVRHTRKALTFPGQRYCTDHDWDVVRVEHDGSRVYWVVPFADAKAREPNPYGNGDVFCVCRKK